MALPHIRRVISSILLALGLVVLLWFWLASAPPTLAGGVVGSGTSGSCDEAAFTSGLSGGGDVTFNCGGPKAIVVVNQKFITQSTTIDGGGQITLTGGLAGARLFNISAGVTLTLRHIILDSFYSAGGSGGAIVNNGTLVLEDSTIQYSQADNVHAGGAIFSNGPVFIYNSLLHKNSAGSGGALFIQNNADTQITNSRFEDNKTLNISSGYGGAIWVNPGTTLNTVDTRFERNTAQFGGAVYVSAGGSATFSGQASDFYSAVFQFNLVTTTSNLNPCSVSLPCSGGAIYSEGDVNASGSLEFYGNSAPEAPSFTGYGGAVASYGTLHINNGVSFAVNKARYGGGLFVGTKAGAPLNSIYAIVQETAFQSNSARALGGGLFTNGYTTVVTTTHSYFGGNTSADSGGGAGRTDARLSIFDSTFLMNQADTAGGGLYVAADGTGDRSRVLVQSTTFDRNQVTNIGSKRGGAIANGYIGSAFPLGGVLQLESVTAISNTNGIFNGGTVTSTLHNTVLANGPFLNCDSMGTAVTSNGHNFSSDMSCPLAGSGDQKGNGLDPILDALQCDIRQCYHLPLAGSPLIDTGASCPPTDQRRAPRVGVCDKGAIEFGGLWRRLLLPMIRR